LINIYGKKFILKILLHMGRCYTLGGKTVDVMCYLIVFKIYKPILIQMLFNAVQSRLKRKIIKRTSMK